MNKILFWLLTLLLAAAFLFVGYLILAGQSDEYLIAFTDKLGTYGTMAAGIALIAGAIGLLLPGFVNGSGSLLSLIMIAFIIMAVGIEEYPMIIPASVALVLLQVTLNLRSKAFPKRVDKIEEIVDSVEEKIEDFFEDDNATT